MPAAADTDPGSPGEATRPRVVLLAGPGDSTNVVFHALTRAFGAVVVVQEDPVPRSTFVRRRLRRLGWPTVAGQLLFVLVVGPALRRSSRARVRSILETSGLDVSPIGEERRIRVPSVNSEECRNALRRLSPAVVVVNGTRVIGEQTLASLDAPFVNMHAGITPRYRGVHGGYWALAEGRPHLVGTTVHLVDKGIDTGTVLGQGLFTPAPSDSFATYPYLHLAAGLPLLLATVDDVLEGRPLRPVPSLADGEGSRLWSHPTFWGYLGARLRSGCR